MYDRNQAQTIQAQENVSKRVNLTLPDVVYDELEAWAEFQGRPTANLAAYLVESAIREAKERGEFKTLKQNEPPDSGTSTKGTGGKGRGKAKDD
ncbi:MAG TPA: hypothetical protein V6D48_05820 [Oculatellaceae cyanobacterium]